MVSSALLTTAGLVTVTLSASFLFWIFAAYGATRFLKLGVCSVCGAVVTVWGLNLFLHFLPWWVTLLLLGQSVVGGAALFRDMILYPRMGTMTLTRYGTLAQLTWFGFILGGTLALGVVGLTLGVR